MDGEGFLFSEKKDIYMRNIISAFMQLAWGKINIWKMGGTPLKTFNLFSVWKIPPIWIFQKVYSQKLVFDVRLLISKALFKNIFRFF